MIEKKDIYRMKLLFPIIAFSSSAAFLSGLLQPFLGTLLIVAAVSALLLFLARRR